MLWAPRERVLENSWFYIADTRAIIGGTVSGFESGACTHPGVWRINVTLAEYKGKRMEAGYTGNIRQPDHSSVQHPVAPLEAALPAIFKALRLPSGIKPPGNRSLGYRGMLGLSI